MGYGVYYDTRRDRDLGYGVPAICDHPDCDKEIDRGLSYVCGGEPYGNEYGCGLYFCFEHLHHCEDEVQKCERCIEGEDEFIPKVDVKEWLEWKLTHPSWEEWRRANPNKVSKIKDTLRKI